MLLKFSVKGFKTFKDEIHFSMVGNKKINNSDNIWNKCNMDIVKSSIIYGPNNTGKSTFISAFKVLKDIIKSGSVEKYVTDYSFEYNFFNDKKEIAYTISFLSNEDIYEYHLVFGVSKKIVHEKLKVNKEIIFDNSIEPSDMEISSVMNLQKSYPDKLMITMLPGTVKKYSDVMKKFFDSLVIIDGIYDIHDIYRSISNYTEKEKEKLNHILKAADISIDSMDIVNIDMKDEKYDVLKLVSFYKMGDKIKQMPSVFSDSKGTKMFLYYIIKILELRKNGGILMIDEIDESLHTLLTKEILNLFNNEENKNMQLIITSHDLMLLDCKYMFRKDQVWFTFKDESDVYFYSLDSFKNHEDNSIRNDILKGYLKGMFGALPNPDIESNFYDEV